MTSEVASTRPTAAPGSRWDGRWCRATARTRPPAPSSACTTTSTRRTTGCAHGVGPGSCCTTCGRGRRRRGRPRPSTSPRTTACGVFIPPGVAHGFASLTDLTLTYLVDSYYNPDDELGVAWDDPGDRRRLGGREPDPVRPGIRPTRAGRTSIRPGGPTAASGPDAAAPGAGGSRLPAGDRDYHRGREQGASGGAGRERASPGLSSWLALVRTARIRQWPKNLLVFAAPGAAGVLTHAGPLLRTLVAFAAVLRGRVGHVLHQ